MSNISNLRSNGLIDLMCALIIGFTGFVVGCAYQEWRHREICPDMPWESQKLEPYSDPINGGVQPENLEFPFSPM